MTEQRLIPILLIAAISLAGAALAAPDDDPYT